MTAEPAAVPVLPADSATPDVLFARFRQLGIGVDVFRHRAVFTVEEARETRDLVPGLHCKNLFLKNKKDRYWLVSLPADKTADLKALEGPLESGRLSFASAPRVAEKLGVLPGSVNPFCIMNETARAVQPVLDAGMMQAPLIGFHPLTNTMTVTLTPADLLVFIRDCGHTPLILDL